MVVKHIKGNPYLYEVESVREGDRVIQKFVAYHGRADGYLRGQRQVATSKPKRVKSERIEIMPEVVTPIAPEPKVEFGVEHAKGVLATRDIGGIQFVGAKNIKVAESTLQKAGLLPTERKLLPTNQLTSIKNLYEEKQPVVGDSFVTPTGERIEVTKIYKTPTGGTSIDYMEMFGKGRIRTIYTNKNWIATT